MTHLQNQSTSVSPEDDVLALQQRIHDLEAQLAQQQAPLPTWHLGDTPPETFVELGAIASDQLLHQVFDSLPQRVFWKDRQYRYLGCNQAFARDAGLASPLDIVGKTDFDLPWAETDAATFQQDDQQVMATGQARINFEKSIALADGEVLWLRASKLPLKNSQGEIFGVFGSYEDISDQKRKETWLKFLVEGTASTTGEAFLRRCVKTLSQALDMRYVFISKCLDTPPTRVRTFCFWANDDYADNFEYDLAGTPCENVVREDCTDVEICRYPSQVQTLFPEDLDLVTLQAESYLGVPILAQDFRILGHIAVLDPEPLSDREASSQEAILRIYAARVGAELERLEAEAALQQKAMELEAALEDLHQAQMQLVQTEKMSSLGQLVAGVAHEINNPVGFIHGNLNHVKVYVQDLFELLELYHACYPDADPRIKAAETKVDLAFLQEDLPKILDSMEGGTDRIQGIIKSLRLFSRLDEAAVKAVDLHEGIDSTLVILGNLLRANGAHAAVEVVKNYGDLPLVECYAGQLNQVFMNILGNAIDALEPQRLAFNDRAEAPDGADPPRITITTGTSPTGEVEIQIADNGPGVPPALQSRLFDPFFTTKAVGKGTGMGLSISYQVVTEKHQGSLSFTSQQTGPQRGTTFVIVIPQQLGIEALEALA